METKISSALDVGQWMYVAGTTVSKRIVTKNIGGVAWHRDVEVEVPNVKPVMIEAVVATVTKTDRGEDIVAIDYKCSDGVMRRNEDLFYFGDTAKGVAQRYIDDKKDA